MHTTRLLRLLTLLLGLAGAGCAAPPRACTAADTINLVATPQGCLVLKTFSPSQPVSHPVLYVVVHGDGSTPGPSVYHYRVAAALAAAGPPGAVAVALIRPGYADDLGQTSDGDSYGHRDNYTAANIAMVADAVAALKAKYAAARVIGVGHSGGAATLGLILGKVPRLLDGAVMVSCPCDLVRWRGGGQPWMRSLSPSSFIASVPPASHVVAITGTNDTNTGMGLARDYVAALSARGVDARFEPAPGDDHNGAFRSPLVIAAAVRLATE